MQPKLIIESKWQATITLLKSFLDFTFNKCKARLTNREETLSAEISVDPTESCTWVRVKIHQPQGEATFAIQCVQLSHYMLLRFHVNDSVTGKLNINLESMVQMPRPQYFVSA